MSCPLRRSAAVAQRAQHLMLSKLSMLHFVMPISLIRSHWELLILTVAISCTQLQDTLRQQLTGQQIAEHAATVVTLLVCPQIEQQQSYLTETAVCVELRAGEHLRVSCYRSWTTTIPEVAPSGRTYTMSWKGVPKA
jgi:hypothetical protein